MKFKTAYSSDHDVETVDLSNPVEYVYGLVADYELDDIVTDDGRTIKVARERYVYRKTGERNVQDEINAAAIGTTIYEVLARTDGDIPSRNLVFGNIADAPKDLLEAQDVAVQGAKELGQFSDVYSSLDDLLNDKSNNKLKEYINAQVEAKLKEDTNNE